MATVYLATDLKHDREVALKVLRPELGAVLGDERFLAEIKITAKLDHPHILTLIDSGVAGGFLYDVLPLVRGESLRDKLNKEKQLGLEEAVAITRQVASAFDYAHRGYPSLQPCWDLDWRRWESIWRPGEASVRPHLAGALPGVMGRPATAHPLPSCSSSPCRGTVTGT